MALIIRPVEQRPGTTGVLATQTLGPGLPCGAKTFWEREQELNIVGRQS